MLTGYRGNPTCAATGLRRPKAQIQMGQGQESRLTGNARDTRRSKPRRPRTNQAIGRHILRCRRQGLGAGRGECPRINGRLRRCHGGIEVSGWDLSDFNQLATLSRLRPISRARDWRKMRGRGLSASHRRRPFDVPDRMAFRLLHRPESKRSARIATCSRHRSTPRQDTEDP